ncbi:hypothetical protein G7050_04930 [Dysgonomonas sp. HDW5A]|uniref:hypothetical protein n=1 Tax=unclassified Dysgonomonas TaxID=2630389 RepID=UPI001407D681|nr:MULTISPECIES: hypothetical protein [unclassified Dysgonomonas]QIK53753.1 hypothetical protein G7051_05080 [Dysgonomonas sp. HDW5B]QIK59221.1 hypothetical protein G7050_04930 [Dysgonomonas sp. HDW5A]
MDEKSTQVTGDEKLLEMLTDEQGPSAKTLSFLKMFAHSYYADPSLPEEIRATCLN